MGKVEAETRQLKPSGLAKTATMLNVTPAYLLHGPQVFEEDVATPAPGRSKGIVTPKAAANELECR